MKVYAIAMAAAFGGAICVTPALAEEASSVTVYGGYYGVDNGYKDRLTTGAFADVYNGDTGLHADVSYVDREQDAGFFSLGVSHSVADNVRAKLMVGTSTDNGNIMPDVFVAGSLQIKPAKGWILTPNMIYRHYRNDAELFSPGIGVAKYFNIAGDKGGYWVWQTDGNLAFTNGGNTGWTLSSGVSTVRNNGLSFGASGRVGYLSYDSIVGVGVKSDVYGGSATAGYQFKGGPEIFLRGDVTHTDFYTVSGAMLGLKFKL